MTKQPHHADVQVGANIRALRTARGMSQEKLGEALGITFQQVQKYEKGANRVSASRLIQICTALSCDLSQLFAGVSADTPSDPGAVPPMSGEALSVAAKFDRIEDKDQRRAVSALITSMVERETVDA